MFAQNPKAAAPDNTIRTKSLAIGNAHARGGRIFGYHEPENALKDGGANRRTGSRRQALTGDYGVARFARIMLIGATVAAGLGTAIVRAQTVLEDPKNAAKIFAGTCSGCHKSPQGLAKSGGTAAFLREHYTTGPEMSASMAAYLASAGNGPPGKKADKPREAAAPADAKTNPAQKHERVSTAPAPNETGPEPTQTPSVRGKQQKNAKGPGSEPPGRMVARPNEPAPLPPERPAAASSDQATAALTTPNAAPRTQAEPAASGPALDLPEPIYPSEPPPDLRQPSAFSSAPLP